MATLNFYKRKNMIAITGGLGYIGLHTAAKLLKENHEVVLIDNQFNSKLFMLERLEQIVGRVVTYVHQDIRNTPALQRIFDQYRVSAVVHLAGMSPGSNPCALEAYNSNVGGVLSLLRAMSRSGINTLVYGSSSYVLGASSDKLSEHGDIDPPGPLARSFDVCEQIMSDLDQQDNWRIAIMRYFEIGGAHSSHLIGEHPKCMSNRIMPVFAHAANTGATVDALSFVFDEPMLSRKIDLLHIDDVVEANLQALAYLHSVEQSYDSFNIGSGQAVSWQQIAAAMEEVSGNSVDLKLPEELSELDRIADISHAKEVLKWEPKLDLQSICADALAFSLKVQPR